MDTRRVSDGRFSQHKGPQAARFGIPPLWRRQAMSRISSPPPSPPSSPLSPAAGSGSPHEAAPQHAGPSSDISHAAGRARWAAAGRTSRGRPLPTDIAGVRRRQWPKSLAPQLFRCERRRGSGCLVELRPVPPRRLVNDGCAAPPPSPTRQSASAGAGAGRRRAGHECVANRPCSTFSAHTLGSPGGGDGFMGGDSDTLPPAGQGLAGPAGGSSVTAELSASMDQAAERAASAGASGYEAGTSLGLADSASDGPSSLGTSHSFVDPRASIDLNLPMGGAVGDTNSVDGNDSGWVIPSWHPQSPDAAAGGDSQISKGYEADHSNRLDRSD